MEFVITLVHKPGKTMKAGPLSLRPDFDTGQNDNKQVIVLPSHLFATISTLSSANLSSWEDCLLQAQFDCPTEISTWQKPHGLIHAPLGLWTYQGCIVVVANDTLRRELVATYHDHITARLLRSGHVGPYDPVLTVLAYVLISTLRHPRNRD